jgi:hypothetical protein
MPQENRVREREELPGERLENISVGEDVLSAELAAVVTIDVKIVEISAVRKRRFFHPDAVNSVIQNERRGPVAGNANQATVFTRGALPIDAFSSQVFDSGPEIRAAVFIGLGWARCEGSESEKKRERNGRLLES